MKFTDSVIVSVLACSLNLQIHLRVAVSGVARGGSKDVNLVTRLDDKRLTNLWFAVEILFRAIVLSASPQTSNHIELSFRTHFVLPLVLLIRLQRGRT